jgi:uncharacterized membrane protein YkvA (DUF1232 family)
MDFAILPGVFVGLLVAWVLLVLLLWIFRPRDVRAGELVRVVPDVLRLVRGLLADPKVSLRVRLSLVVLLAWLVRPIDLVPEFIPVLGPLDDVVVTILVLRYVRRRLGEDVLRTRWRGTPEGFDLLTGILGR